MAARQKLSVTVIGPGSLGRVLALALSKAGSAIDEVVARPGRDSQQRAVKVARACGAKASTLETATLASRVIWLCVPDDSIRKTARALAKRNVDWKGKIVLHSSGALSSAELYALRRKGAFIASAHPMNTFVSTSKPSLVGTPLALEGDRQAVEAAAALAESLQAEPFVLKTKDKVLYHAVGSFSSPLLISLLAMAEKIGKSAGLKHPRKVMARILMQTMQNYHGGTAKSAFSGPLFRGDVQTIARHLKALKTVKGAPQIYRALASSAVETLPGKNKAALRRLLK